MWLAGKIIGEGHLASSDRALWRLLFALLSHSHYDGNRQSMWAFGQTNIMASSPTPTRIFMFTFRRRITKSLAMWTQCDLVKKCSSRCQKPNVIGINRGETSGG
jgi:hypothetical protein